MTTEAMRVGRTARTQRGWSSPEALPWLAPLLAVATLFFLWPVLNVLRLAVTDSTLLRDDYAYTLQTFEQVLSDPSLP